MNSSGIFWCNRGLRPPGPATGVSWARRARSVSGSVAGKGQKRHINFLNVNFLPPTRKPPFWAPRKNLCASFPGEERQKGPTKIFSGGFPNGPFWATKRLVYCSFPGLSRGVPKTGVSPRVSHGVSPGPFKPRVRSVQKVSRDCPQSVQKVSSLAHQNRTIAIASDFRVDGAKSLGNLPLRGSLRGSVSEVLRGF